MMSSSATTKTSLFWNQQSHIVISKFFSYIMYFTFYFVLPHCTFYVFLSFLLIALEIRYECRMRACNIKHAICKISNIQYMLTLQRLEGERGQFDPLPLWFFQEHWFFVTFNIIISHIFPENFKFFKSFRKCENFLL